MKNLLYVFFLPILFFPKNYVISPSKVEASNLPSVTQKAYVPPKTSQQTAIQYATEQSELLNVPVKRALWILSHESQDCTNLYGDDGNSRGCWMISAIWNPEVTKKCALNLVCSTAWSLPLIKTNPNLWSTWACRYVWFYQDAIKTFGLPPENYKEPKYCK